MRWIDSYQGLNCKVGHTLIVSAVTRFLATTPSAPFKIHLQRVGCSTASRSEMKYQKIVLPFDWTPDETVPTIRLTEIAALHDKTGVVCVVKIRYPLFSHHAWLEEGLLSCDMV
jgi:hypothetical protein